MPNSPLAQRSLLLYTGIMCMACVFLSCGIQIKQASLYDGREVTPPPARPVKISMSVEPVIFEDDGTDFWVMDDPNCTSGGVITDVVHTGENAIMINWNRNPAECEWAGFGIGWDGYAGKDLSEVFDHAAIQMYVRSQKGEMFGLPVVLTLEDYSGNMAWSYTSNKYFERYFIDEEWQKIVVPLNTFDLAEDGLDITNIKQLMFELQQSGAIYLDDVRLVFYEPEEVSPWMEEPALDDPLAFPVQLFDDAFVNDNGWGIFSDHCQDITITSSEKSKGSKSIHAVWDATREDCYMVALGVSWNRWYSVDMSTVASSTKITFDARGKDAATRPEVRIGFEDYDRAMSLVTLAPEFIDGGSLDSEWRQVTIPVTALMGNADLANIKQLVIRMEGSGEMFIDNLRLVAN